MAKKNGHGDDHENLMDPLRQLEIPGAGRKRREGRLAKLKRATHAAHILGDVQEETRLLAEQVVEREERQALEQRVAVLNETLRALQRRLEAEGHGRRCRSCAELTTRALTAERRVRHLEAVLAGRLAWWDVEWFNAEETR